MRMPCFPNKGRRFRRYPHGPAETFESGAALVLVGGLVTECGADPASILGFAMHAAGEDPEGNFVTVALAYDDSTFFIEADTLPNAANVGSSFDIATDADGIWYINTASNANPRLRVEAADPLRKYYEVSVLAANRQLA